MALEELHDPAAAAHAAENGGTNPDDLEVVALLEAQVASRQVRADELHVELAAVESELRRYTKALGFLTGVSPAKPGPKGPRKAATTTGNGRPASKHGRISDRLVEGVKTAILVHCNDHEEFRQVDIRNQPGLDGAMTKSSTMALAFEALRQDNVIRLARSDGNNKWFRLTREALNNG